MKIKDLFSEARRAGQGRIGASGGAKRYQTDRMVDVTLQKHLYDREKAAAKAAAPKEPAVDRDPRDLNHIKIQTIFVPIKEVEHWRETRDVNWALKTAEQKNWKIGKLPENIRQKIYNDPKWQEVILDIWKLAEYLLALEEKTSAKTMPEEPLWWKYQKRKGEEPTEQPPEWWDSRWASAARRSLGIKKSGKTSYAGKNRAKEAGINDPELNAPELERRLFKIVKDIAENNGYDLTGRRLPPRAW